MVLSTCAFARHLLLALVLQAPAPTTTPTPGMPAGHWEGTIQTPGAALEIQVDLASRAPGTWEGTITIPAQRLTALPLSGIAVDGTSVTFGMKSVPGAPSFKGTLSPDSRAIAGEFSQGGGTLPFTLAWKGEARIETPPTNKPVEKEFEGAWQGSINADGNKLRLRLELANHDGAATGTLTSLDQGGIELPLRSIVQVSTHLTVTVPTVGGRFEGDLKDGRLDGTWTQGELSLPLVFVRPAP